MSKMSWFRRMLVLKAVGVIVLVLLVCFATQNAWSGSQRSGTKSPIRIAFNTWIGYSSFYIATDALGVPVAVLRQELLTETRFRVDAGAERGRVAQTD